MIQGIQEAQLGRPGLSARGEIAARMEALESKLKRLDEDRQEAQNTLKRVAKGSDMYRKLIAEYKKLLGMGEAN